MTEKIKTGYQLLHTARLVNKYAFFGKIMRYSTKGRNAKMMKDDARE